MAKEREFLTWVRRSCGFGEDIAGESQEGLLQSRMDSLANCGFRRVWVKRDDELGGWVGGSKSRKLASLIPYLVHAKIEDAILIGSHGSNFILTAVARLINLGIHPHLILHGPAHNANGNPDALARMIDPSSITWVTRKDWGNATNMAQHCAETLRGKGRRVEVIAEGGAHFASLPGACTLAVDLKKNIDQLMRKDSFAAPNGRIYCDAGTGFTVQATLLGWAALQGPAWEFRVVLMAGDEETFRQDLYRWAKVLANALSWEVEELNSHIPPFQLMRPPTAKSFGAINRQVRLARDQALRQTGIDWDPVYGVKLWMRYLEDHRLQAVPEKIPSNTVLVHSGMGFLGWRDF